MSPKWTKSGKTWDTLGKLRSMITMIINHSYSKINDLSDWEIIEYEVTEVSAKDPHEIMSAKNIQTILTR